MAPTRGGPNRKCLVLCGLCRLISVLLVLATSGKLASSLRFTSVQMPALVQRGTNFWLSCQYELSRSAVSDNSGVAGGTGEQVYSVKWYRNNEEFYRLIYGGQQQQQQHQQQQHLESHSRGPPLSPHQQQYFAQAGVNVLMSASNATHVRLLNASLESDGSYACEISTQNLSTIRHEKEIKVYVLPHLKLNLIGLRSMYTLDERVELNCLSDFSRPAGALGWFINGQQIKPNSRLQATQSSGHFELAASTRHKSSEPKLSRASLALKFKLTNELMRTLSASEPHTTERANSVAGNQSKPLLMKSFVNGETTAASISGARLFELLKLECRYKLTEVSDVTFNELRVAVASSTPLAAPDATSLAPRRTGSNSDRSISSPSSSAELPSHTDEDNVRRRRGAAEFKLSKSHGTQVSQSACPVRRADLLAAVGVASSASACHLDMLAREDPVILEPELLDVQDPDPDSDPNQDETDQDQSVPPSRPGGPLELPLGFALSVNCSTLGALFAPQTNPVRVAPLSVQPNLVNKRRLLQNGGLSGHAATPRTSANSPRWPIITMGANDKHDDDDDDGNDDRDQPTPAGGVYCSDPGARKRLLVSGRTWTPWRVHAAEDSAQQQNQQQQRRHHVAYVNLASSSSSGSGTSTTRKQQAPLDDKLSLLAETRAGARPRQPRKSLVAGQLHHAAAAVGVGVGQEEEELEEWQEEGPPPLLEWFINNQEAPRSSARYAPELPLLTAGLIYGTGKHLDERSKDGTTSGEEPLTQPLPSIDYVQYFANFERKRPVDQHLMLQLSLEKRHFMTSDSLLKLRCSSTQAQVLASDALSVSLMVLPQGGATSLILQTLEQQQQTVGGQDNGLHWNQRRPSHADRTPQSQIKPKYLHQYPPRISSQARQGASAEQRHLARGQVSSPPDSASVSESSGTSGSNLYLAALDARASVCCLMTSLFVILKIALM